MNMITKRIIGLVLALALVAGFVLVPSPMDIEAQAATVSNTKLCDYIQDGATLHCWNWSIANIRANLGLIANMGYSSIQLSPMQELKESGINRGYDGWWVVYQPISFNINTAPDHTVGTKDELVELCAEAHKYGIKVIMDVVCNHTANNGNNAISPLVDPELLNDPSCWHDYSKNSWDYGSRYNITQYCMAGLPDLNTGNQKVQDKALALLKEYIDCGVDGFRFDAAKQIETPRDDPSCASDFWPTVVGGATSYAASTRGIMLYCYGELLEQADNYNSLHMSAYTEYMSVTESVWSNDVRYKLEARDASALQSSYFKEANADKLVLWAESHDTFGDGSSVYANQYYLDKAWALISSRAYTMSLFFPRANDMVYQEMGELAKVSWTSKLTQEVNRFHNHFAGQWEHLTKDSFGNMYYNERGNSGIMIVNFNDGGRFVDIPVYSMASGVYYDQITGNQFTVSNGRIYGAMGDTGVAVVYNPSTKTCNHPSHGSDGYCYSCYTYVGHKSGTTCSTCGTASTRTVYFNNTGNWSNVYVYGWHDTGAEATASWPGTKMTKVSGSRYKVTLPNNATNVIFHNNSGTQTANLVVSAQADTYEYSTGFWTNQNENYTDYYLFGYINGADYGTGDDYANMGQYKFVDNQLTVRFDTDSYVGIKTTRNANWYLTKSYVSGTSGTFYDSTTGANEKMLIPGGKEVTLKLTVNSNGTLGLSYSTTTCSHSYTSKITTAATCDSAGVRTYTCSKCGDSYTASIAATGHSYSGGSCTVCGAADPNAVQDYYLFGYINGADYAIGADQDNLGQYKFVDNKLTVTFDETSYVAVKTGDNKSFYMTNGYVGAVTSTNLYKFTDPYSVSANKLEVPGGQKVTFTLSENWDGNLILSYTVEAGTCLHISHNSEGICSTCGATVEHTYSLGVCTVCNAMDPNYSAYDYYLFGYINGDNYGCENDSGNLGEYKFVGGKLTAIFDADSYIAVKKVNPGAKFGPEVVGWYMTKGWLGTDVTKATLYSTDTLGSNADKLYVPGNVSLTFTLTTNSDGTLQLSYTAADCEHRYTSKVTTTATCVKPGVKTYTCTYCGDSYTETIPAGTHGYTEKITTAATCTTTGVKTFTCSGCGDRYTETIPATGHSYSGGKCIGCGAADPNTGSNTAYYLFGYINGTDYAYDNDLGSFKFVNGKLKVTFSQDSYVGVKTSDNAKWYMTDGWQGMDKTSVTLYDSSKLANVDKFYVPGNVEVIFTLKENSDGSLTLSYSPSNCEHTYEGGFCTICGEADPNGSGSSEDYYLFGYINGQDYACGRDAGSVGQYRFVGGKLTVTFTTGSYVAIKTGDNAKWYMTNGWQGVNKTSVTMYESDTLTDADKFYVPGNVQVTFMLTENSDGSLTLKYTTGSTGGSTGGTSTAPTFTLKYPTVSFEEMVVLNIYYEALNVQDVEEMGLVTYDSKVTAGNINSADHVIPGYTWSSSAGLYFSSSAGIAAKNLGDTLYFAIYARLKDGSYAYSNIASYSPKTYAYNQLKTGSDAMKKLVVAMLNYGAAAQTKFGYKTNALVNADLTAAQKSLISNYSTSMVTSVTQPTAAQMGQMTNNGGYVNRYPTVSFEGVFSINYYFQPSQTPVGNIRMYMWTQEDYVAGKLSKNNATMVYNMTPTSSSEYVAVVDGIAAKDLDDVVYVSFCYSDGTTDYCSGVVAYSIGQYCKTQASKTGTMADLAKACAVYGYYAKQRFG